MTFDHDPEADRLDELDPDLRDRILALDEPVARNDWADVLKQSRTLRSRAFVLDVPTRLTVSAAAVTLVAVLVGASVLGLWPPTPSTKGQSAGAASRHVTPDRALRVPPLARRLAELNLAAQGLVRADFGQFRGEPLHVAWARGRVVGVVAPGLVSSVTIRFTDGTSVQPKITWPSMVDIGVFRYAIPTGKTVAEVIANDNGRPSHQVNWYSV